MTVSRTSAAWFIASVIAQVPTAPAGSPDSVPMQAIGLFMQSCIQFAGDCDGLRSWAKRVGLQTLPISIQLRFLGGLPGIV